MNLQKFVEKFAEQFDETDVSEFQASTKFKTLVDWSSMVALSIIAMVDNEFNVTIKGDEIKKATTVEELFNIVQEYKSQS